MKGLKEMQRLCLFDAKPYDRIYFDKYKTSYGFDVDYFETKLNPKTAVLAKGKSAVIAFVNDDLGAETINTLHEIGIRCVALRCSGFNNADLEAAKGKLRIFRVPNYSPYSVAEHSIAMLLTLNRKTHKAYLRTRDFNFSLNGFVGFDLHGKTIGIVGTGKIGMAMVDICNGFGMKVLAYDPFPQPSINADYVTLEELLKKSDIVSLNCPLSKDSYSLINSRTLKLMKPTAIIMNTSRGALIDSEALLDALVNERLGGACLDVYDEETELFFEDYSNHIMPDHILARLISLPNVLVTSHQAFLTHDALSSIARTTLYNITDFLTGRTNDNEVTV